MTEAVNKNLISYFIFFTCDFNGIHNITCHNIPMLMFCISEIPRFI